MKRKTDTFRWQELTLPVQFLVAGAFVMLVAMFLVGNWMAQRIEAAVVQNSGTSAALFMESFISPLSQEIADTNTLSPPARQALAEIFSGTSLGERVVSYKIWMPGGVVVHASDPALIGQTFPPSDDLLLAFSGQVASGFEDLNDLEDQGEAALGVPLLEVYTPIREAWTGDIIAVAEFYEVADQLANDIASARTTSWLIVGGAFLGSGVLLFGIVQAGGRTIGMQQQRLTEQLQKTEDMSRQNARLRMRAVAASARAVAQTEQAIRRIGSDLHDGPAQYLSLASLRLEGALATAQSTGNDALLVRESLDKALEELRMISRGLALPDLESLGISTLVERVVKDHQRQTELQVAVEMVTLENVSVNYAQKLCIFRFLQESLSNVSRHAHAQAATVQLHHDKDGLTVSVTDSGAGFDPDAAREVRTDGGQGLLGLKDRAESLGGALAIQSGIGAGTTLTLTLPIEEGET